jgi:hypothetical protein
MPILAVAACTSTGDGEGGSTLGNFLAYGAATPPPLARQGDVEAQDCPPVIVAEGRSAIRGGGEGGAVRSQVSIANLARECIERPDGSIVVKVGIEGRALLGPGGGAARFDVPVTIELKRGDRVLASRTRRTAVQIPAGQLQGSFVVVEGDLLVPPGTGDFDIEVGLGGSAAPSGRTRRRSSGG